MRVIIAILLLTTMVTATNESEVFRCKLHSESREVSQWNCVGSIKTTDGLVEYSHHENSFYLKDYEREIIPSMMIGALIGIFASFIILHMCTPDTLKGTPDKYGYLYYRGVAYSPIKKID